MANFVATDYALVEDRGGQEWYVVDPGVVIPAVVARLQDIAGGREYPSEVELGSPIVVQMMEVAKLDLERANVPFGDDLLDQDRQARALVLQMCWSWYKAALSRQVGRGIRLHILANDRYKE